jgi:hypothetical protein
MGRPIATKTAVVTATDTHIVMVPSAAGPIPTPLPHPFVGQPSSGLVQTVKVMGQPTMVDGAKVANRPPHIATPPGITFQSPPADEGASVQASATVKAGGKGVILDATPVKTCNDPSDLPVGTLTAPGTVKGS